MPASWNPFLIQFHHMFEMIEVFKKTPSTVLIVSNISHAKAGHALYVYSLILVQATTGE